MSQSDSLPTILKKKTDADAAIRLNNPAHQFWRECDKSDTSVFGTPSVIMSPVSTSWKSLDNIGLYAFYLFMHWPEVLQDRLVQEKYNAQISQYWQK